MKNPLIISGIIFALASSCAKYSDSTIIDLTPSRTSTPTIIQSYTYTVSKGILPSVMEDENIPYSFYFLINKTKNEKLQIFAIPKGDTELKQITYEPNSVVNIDVSHVNGDIIFIEEQDLFIIDKNGNNKRIIANNIRRMQWSPDGETIAYWNGELNIFSINENKILYTYKFINKNIYGNMQYSPNGELLAIQYEKYSFVIIDLNSHNITNIQAQADRSKLYSSSSALMWSGDSKNLYLWESIDGGAGSMVIWHGLWKFDIYGKGGPVFPTSTKGGQSEYISAPWQKEISSELNYLLYQQGYNKYKLVKSDNDGISNRKVIRNETYNIYCNYPRPKWLSEGTALLIPESESCLVNKLLYVPTEPTHTIRNLLHDIYRLYDYTWGP
jgi:hypothetical protein